VRAFVTLALAALFGAGDQYLGSVSAHPWAADVSLLSAPWLVLAFLAGCTQRAPRRAAMLGLACTTAALVGYGAMTLSPLENAHASLQTISAFVRSEAAVILGGLVTGPLFGWFGQQWRTRRAWLGALVTAAAVCCEPLARIPAGHEVRFRAVWMAEVAAGLAMAAYVAVARAMQTRSR
jgi:mannitol-specific phosphotransferase system IIBC component